MNQINKLIGLLALSFPLSLVAQGWVNNGAQVQVSANTEIYLQAGNLIQQNDASLDNEGTISLEQNWSQTGSNSTYTGNGSIQLIGSNDQTISSNSNLSIANLSINNAHKLILGSALSISNHLDLSNNGQVQLDANTLTLSLGASISNYDDSHYIITNSTGTLQQEVSTNAVVFPVGNSSYNPTTLTNTGTVDDFQVRIEDVVYDNGTTGSAITSGVVNRTWYVEELHTGGADVTMTVQWDAVDELPTDLIAGFDRNNCGISSWDGSQWDGAGTYSAATAGTGTYYTQLRSGLSDFTAFSVVEANEVVTSEMVMNNNSAATQLRQPEESASALITTSNSSNIAASNNMKLTLFPNPTANWLNVQLEEAEGNTATIRIYTSNGQLSFEQQAPLVPGSPIQLQAITQLPAGTYLLQAILENGAILSAPFVKH